MSERRGSWKVGKDGELIPQERDTSWQQKIEKEAEDREKNRPKSTVVRISGVPSEEGTAPYREIRP